MRNYKIIVKASGAITQIPDSQKIFGALISHYARIKGDGKAAELVKSVLEKRVHLALSDALPLDCVPMPFEYVIDRLKKTISEDSSLKEMRKEIKKKAYIEERDLKKVLHDPKEASRLSSYVTMDSGQQLRASMDSIRYGVEGLETKLYTVPVTKVMKVEKSGETRPASEFYFYLQGNDDEIMESLLSIIQRFQETQESMILGKRGSQGLNLYRIKDIRKVDITGGNSYLNLGMLLPEQINFSGSFLKLFTSERRPFDISRGDKRYFISFIESGSIIVLNNGIKSAGKCVPSPFNPQRDIVFGNAFLYPISI